MFIYLQQRCIYLKRYYTYKKLKAAIVALVTMLLVLPLKQLHSHTSDTGHWQASDTTISADCSICSYDYSPANADAVAYVLSAKPIYYKILISHYENADDVAINACSNKSPPFVL